MFPAPVPSQNGAHKLQLGTGPSRPNRPYRYSIEPVSAPDADRPQTGRRGGSSSAAISRMLLLESEAAVAEPIRR